VHAPALARARAATARAEREATAARAASTEATNEHLAYARAARASADAALCSKNLLGIDALSPAALLKLLLETVRGASAGAGAGADAGAGHQPQDGAKALMAALRQDVKGKGALEALKQRATADATLYGELYRGLTTFASSPSPAAAADNADNETDAKLAQMLALDKMGADELRALLLETVRGAGERGATALLAALRKEVSGATALLALRARGSADPKVYGEMYRQLAGGALASAAAAKGGAKGAAELDAAAEAAAAAAAEAGAVAARSAAAQRAEASVFGSDLEWKGWKGQCVEHKAGDFVYELCPFGKATQTTPHGTIALGAFVVEGGGGGEGEEEEEKGGGGGLVWRFTGGETCPNGVARSAVVHVECAPVAGLLAVSEPAPCAYRMRFGAAAACTAAEAVRVGITEEDLDLAAAAQGAGRDEL
jgi:hypothetical protein